MLMEGYVLLQPEDMEGEDGGHHVVAGGYETEEQRLVSMERQCLGCRGIRREDAHIPPYRFIGHDPEQIRNRLERLRHAGTALCAGCAKRLVSL